MPVSTRPVLGFSPAEIPIVQGWRPADRGKHTQAFSEQSTRMRPEGRSAKNPSGLTWRVQSNCGTLERERLGVGPLSASRGLRSGRVSAPAVALEQKRGPLRHRLKRQRSRWSCVRRWPQRQLPSWPVPTGAHQAACPAWCQLLVVEVKVHPCLVV
eukprot:6175595-Amphidinium_carterae.1